MDVITPKRIRITIKTVRAIIFISVLLLIFFSTILFSILLFAKTQGAPSLTVSQSTILYASDGSKIGETHNGQRRYWVKLEDISDEVLQATLAIEDRNFYEHHGFDYKRIAGAALADLKAMAKVQGASTITQQYARNLFLEHEKTWKRKALEALYTIRLEMNYSKDDILEGYLNTIYYGHGVYGIEAASNYYFGKTSSELTLAEASLLTGIPKGPTIYSPFVHEERAKKRQEVILNTMLSEKYITKEQLQEAVVTKLIYKTKKEAVQTGIAPYFHDTVMKILANQLKMDEHEITTKGLRIYTTLDPDMQKKAENIMESTIEKESDIQAGIVAIHPQTGEVKALVGGRDYEKSQFNRVTQAKRQPGSTMKPLLYYAALTKGFTPSTEMRSEPTSFTYNDGKSTYKPSNFNDYYANDLITLLQAIALSDNIYAVKTHLFLGMEELLKTSKLFGVESKLDLVPSLALGTSPVRLLDMVNAYGILGNGGKKIEPTFITKVEDASGNVLYEHSLEPKQILEQENAFVATHLMTGMFDKRLNDYASVTGQSIAGSLTRDYAGKSGTTSTDSWMIGLTPQLVTGVWTGYDKDKTIDLVQEKAYAKKIWATFMEKALEDQPVKAFRPPNDVVGVYINPETGKLATEDCPVRRLTYYVAGTEPTHYCTVHLDDGEHDEKQPNKDVKSDDGWMNKLFKWWD
ncbi:transglycosylase domain-containing protein [Metabacillus herbersteinensis]|uniref:Transglycosylase domain-containing protein n=1 Tax=Metabacillus herbersteinensis TaxID=283816 RepID=A0ABV6GHK0_9BACI